MGRSRRKNFRMCGLSVFIAKPKSKEVKAECSDSRATIRGDWDELTLVGDDWRTVALLLVPCDDEVRHPQQRAAFVALRQISDQSAGQIGVAVSGGECVID